MEQSRSWYVEKRRRATDGRAESPRKRCRPKDGVDQAAPDSNRRRRGGEGGCDRPRRVGWSVVAERSKNREADIEKAHDPQSEEEDIEREMERIRLRRQEILKKHKKKEQSGVGSLSRDTVVVAEYANVPGPASNLAGAIKLPLEKNGCMISMDVSMLNSRELCSELVDFIFGESPVGGPKLVLEDNGALASETSGLSDNWDDEEGYYCHRIDEVMDSNYKIVALQGRGVFSSVVRARPLKRSTTDLEEVAIKIIRNNDIMRKSGKQELNILKKLGAADPENKQHCVRLLTSFGYRNHLCLVFESLHMSLREVLKKFGTGLNLCAVRMYAKQLFSALKHLRNCGVLHCDIKPDNMLVNKAMNVLKLCDFGSATLAQDGDSAITPYLVSRFYRAPEIILGLRYDHALDMWSAGCCLYEFFTGKVLFPGATNNDMLRLHIELKGPFPKKMLKKAYFVSEHFDGENNFCATLASSKNIASIVTGGGTLDKNVKMLGSFKDLLDKIFMLDPDKRLTVTQALSHPFITGK